MPLRPPAGFISAFFDPLRNPDAPTIGTATGAEASASVTFTPPTNVGGSAISSYSALSNPGQVIGTASSSPITVTGLTNGTAYTFAVWATNTYGPSAYSASSNSVTPAVPPPNAVFGGGVNPSIGAWNTISYINIANTGNAKAFGQLTVIRQYLGACSSTTRGVFTGGQTESPPYYAETMDYVTIASTGNATNFGNLLPGQAYDSALSNGTRGVIAAGTPDGSNYQVMDYITIASTGNSTDFGSLVRPAAFLSTCASPTRGLIGGRVNESTNGIQYITTATTGNATVFGNLTSPGGLSGAYTQGGCSSSTRGLFAGGISQYDVKLSVIQYVTIATTGNASTFGELSGGRFNMSAASSELRGVFLGGQNSSSTSINLIEYVTIASTGNASNFGYLTAPVSNLAGCSNCHGGLA